MQTADPDAPIEAIVLFSGPGGSSLGLRNAGVARTTGVEFDPSYKKAGVQPAVATALAAGLETVQSDVRTLDPLDFAPLERLYHLLVQASPPCQGLSMAGKGKGRDDLVHLLKVLKIIAGLPMESTAQWARWYIAHLEKVCSDDRSPLTFEVVRWVAKLNPEYVMLEQVPAALPIWQAIGEVLEAWGYSVWTGNVQAEQYGVPQTRKRAMLIASRLHEVSRPRPTRSKYHTRDRARGSTKSRNDGIRVSVEEAGVLQSFPGDYPWQGTMTAQFQQVGNAVPPLLQEALTRSLLADREAWRQEATEAA